MTSIARMSQVLSQLCKDCPDVQGAVVATQDGLILAAIGQLNNEVAAATAVQITSLAEHYLSLIRKGSCEELLIRSSSAFWYITRTSHGCIVMVAASRECNAGMLRLVIRSIDMDVAVALSLDGQPN